MATRPDIDVIEDAVTIQDNVAPGMASRVAVIGAFDSTTTDVTVCTSKETAHSVFGTTSTLGNFKGTDAIDYLFMGASELIVVNITTWSDDSTPVASTSITTEKLTAALAKLHNEVFDMLFVADELADASQTIVSTWLASEFGNKFCHGQVAQLSKGTTSAYTTSVATFNKHVYYINTQQLTVNGTTLNLNQSTAFMCGLIAAREVNRSLTAKVLPDVSAVSPEYTFESGDVGAKLLELNVPFAEVRNRRLQEVICVNSLLPDSLDMSVNRTRDYVINKIQAELLLGEQNSDLTEDTAQLLVEKVRNECVDTLHLLKDIVYHIERISATEIDIVLDKLVFDGIITKVKIHYAIEVQ